MASQQPDQPAATPEHDDVTHIAQSQSEAPRAPSVVSSRMTDIASEDEGTGKPAGTNAASQAETSKSGGQPSKGRRASQTGRRTYAQPPKRGSITSTASGSAAKSGGGRSHVPSLTSGAFFRPMSSQKLQAQRAAAARPAPSTTLAPAQPENLDDGLTDAGGSVVGASYVPPRSIPVPRKMSTGDGGRPRSHATEMTEQDTNFDRVTGNTSPTQGHYPTGSLSDSVRPLYGKAENPQTWGSGSERPHKETRQSSEKRRSFRSSFLLPGRVELGQVGGKRSTDGAEKLSSAASSPRLRPTDSRPQYNQHGATGQSQADAKGRVHQYFDGNTVFCLGGRWQNTKHRPINVATGIFVVVPCVLFFIFEASWLWHHISPAIPIVFAYLAYVCTSSFIHASVSDPGVSSAVWYLGNLDY